MGRGKNVLLGVTGGIAAYKMPDLVRLLRKRNINVHVAMTEMAERFVTPMTLATVSDNTVLTSRWMERDNTLEHLDISRKTDLALIAPATANFIGKLAAGIADDVLLTIALALECPVFVAPSMNPRMYSNMAVQENLNILAQRGIHIIRPDVGDTACGEHGEGRLPQLERLAAVLEQALGLQNDLAGKKLVVTAGRTEEPLDSVRFISNRSSGKMGIALAAAARDRGAEVTLVHGVVSEPLPEMIETLSVRTAAEMNEETMRRFQECDIMIMAAAVADFKPARLHDSKIKKTGGGLTIPLVPTQDIMESMGKLKSRQILVGFAAETENHTANAREKLLRKNADLICVNDVSRDDIGFDSPYNQVTFVTRADEIRHTDRLTKKEIAQKVLDEIVRLAGVQMGKGATRDG
jgi:phosphopantothenoylcysteine decarboxylase/phosphopantothenate--cysteine ligase